MNYDIHQYVQGCVVYQRTKPYRHCMYGTVMPLPIPMRQFSEISMNFMTDLPLSALNDYIHDTVLVIIN